MQIRTADMGINSCWLTLGKDAQIPRAFSNVGPENRDARHLWTSLNYSRPRYLRLGECERRPRPIKPRAVRRRPLTVSSLVRCAGTIAIAPYA